MKGKVLKRKKPVPVDADGVTLAKLEALVSFAQVRNDGLQAALVVWQERAAVLEAKVVILQEMLAGSQEAVAVLRYRVGRVAEAACEVCVDGVVEQVDMVTGEVYRGGCVRCGGGQE